MTALLVIAAALLVLCLALASVAAALAWQAAREARTAAQHAHATALQLARHAVQAEHLANAVERSVTGAHPAARPRKNTRGEKRAELDAQNHATPKTAPPPEDTWGVADTPPGDS